MEKNPNISAIYTGFPLLLKEKSQGLFEENSKIFYRKSQPSYFEFLWIEQKAGVEIIGGTYKHIIQTKCTSELKF